MKLTVPLLHCHLLELMRDMCKSWRRNSWRTVKRSRVTSRRAVRLVFFPFLNPLFNNTSSTELKAASSLISKRVAKHHEKIRRAEKFREKHTRLAETSKQQNRLAVKRLKKMLGTIQKTQDLVEKDKSQTYESRMNAYVALKNNVDRMYKEMKAKNDVNREREEIRAMVQKQKFDKILQEGRNPYEVFRKKRVDRAYENQRQRLLDEAEESANILRQRIEKEKEYQKQKDEERAREQKYEEKYQQEMGRSVVEKRVEKYLRSKTLNGDDMLDTTGHVYNLFPSQLTNIKDPSFGTGYDSSERTCSFLQCLCSLFFFLQCLCSQNTHEFQDC